MQTFRQPVPPTSVYVNGTIFRHFATPQAHAWAWAPGRFGQPLGLTALALVFVLLNAALPLQIDDSAYFYYARQVAKHPFDPYGFELIWYEQRQPAMEVLAPPLLPYWWALAIRLFGDQVFLWKLWLLPFGLTLFFALFELFQRFANGLQWELTLMLTFSPAFLPSFNLMLDLPALALCLLGLATFLRACDSMSIGLTLLAGVFVGMAMQTKYTALLGPPAMLLYAWSAGRLRTGILASLVALALFAAWEGFLLWRYGQSHFWFHLLETGIPITSRYVLILPLFSILGAVAPAGALVNLCALGARRFWIGTVACLAGLGYVVVAAQDHELPASLVFGATGVLVGVTSLLVAWRLLELPLKAAWKGWPGAMRNQEGFLVLWVGLELAGYFLISPFAAVRRVLGLLVAGSMVTGRLAAATCQSGESRTLLRTIVAANVILGLAFYAVDWRDAQAERQAVETALASIHPAAGETVWYVGHWGFQFYAESAGMQPVIPYESCLQEGDWLVVPDARINQQEIDVDEKNVEHRDTVVIADRLPLGVIPCFYGGGTPVKHPKGSRIEVKVYRVRRPFQALPQPSQAELETKSGPPGESGA
jgi:Dolichyl-phosphate-mannose-protein mannosyltransferase